MALFDDAQTKALRGQLRALDAPRYEVTVRTPDDGVQVALISGRDLMAQEKWLRGQNAAGAQVRLRPADPSPLVLVGPLRGEQLDRMAVDGFPGAVVTAVGDDRYEAWVRLDRAPIPVGLATALGQALNDRYTDGGPDGAPATGSLAAGFVDTRDPLTRTPEGGGLYVDVTTTVRDREVTREVAPGAAALRAELLEHMRLPTEYFARDTRGPQERDATRLEGLARRTQEEPARWTQEQPAPWDDRTAWQDALLAQQPVERPPAWVCERDGSVDLDAVDRLNPGVQSLLRAPYSREVAVAQGLDLDTLGRGEALSWVRDNLDAIAQVPVWWHKGFRSPEAREEAMNRLADSLQAGGIPVAQGVPVERAGALPVAEGQGREQEGGAAQGQERSPRARSDRSR